MTQLFWDINQLKENPKNSRKTSDEDLQRLFNQVQIMGQYKPLLIDSTGTVLGGNHRLQVFRELGIEKVWVSVVEFVEIDGVWYPIVNGEKMENGYDSKEAGQMAYALSDNDRVAKYVEDELLENMTDLNLDENLFSVDLLDPTLLVDLAQIDESQRDEPEKKPEVTPEMNEKLDQAKPTKYALQVYSDDAVNLESLKTKLHELGYEVSKIESISDER